jgi:hypothetical protein
MVCKVQSQKKVKERIMYVYKVAVYTKKPLLNFSDSSCAHVITLPHSPGEFEEEIYLTR